MQKKPRLYEFLINPLYWPLWCVVLVLWCLAQLPYRLQMRLGSLVGLFIWRFLRKGQQVARINIQLCFPELSLVEREALVKANCISMGKFVFEALASLWGNRKRLQSLLHIKNNEYSEQAVQMGKPIVVIGAHFTSLEIVGRLFAMRIPYGVVYRPHKIKFIEYFNGRILEKQFAAAIPRHDVRAMVRALKNGVPVWMTPDVDAGKKGSVFAPFFKIPTATVTTPSRLASMTNAVVLPVSFYRREDGRGYDLYFEPPLANFPSEDPVVDATRINQVIEAQIRKAPAQYLWQYKRFKTRPQGEARFYGKAR